MTAQELKPSAWLVHSGHVFADKVFLSESYAKESVTSRNDGSQVSLLYLQPVARTPLTDEQIADLQEKYVGGPCPSYPLDASDWINFARAIERAHGITQESKQGEQAND